MQAPRQGRVSPPDLSHQSANPDDPRVLLDRGDVEPVRKQIERELVFLQAQEARARREALATLSGRDLKEELGRIAGRYLQPVEWIFRRAEDYLHTREGRTLASTPAWAAPKGSFPQDPAWAVDHRNVTAWAAHRFEAHFSERVLRLMGNPEGHPLFELRMDLLEYEVLFCRFVGIPHHPRSGERAWLRVRYRSEAYTCRTCRSHPAADGECRCHPAGTYELTVPRWDVAGEEELAHILAVPTAAGAPEPWAAASWRGPWEPVQPATWTPDERLLQCLQASCKDYVAGLVMYLRPGREHWGAG